MARCPFAEWRPIPPQEEYEKSKWTRPLEKTQLILHSAAGSYTGSLAHWEKAFNWRVHSTFFVLNDGTLIQLMDTDYRTAANVSSNGRSISVETEDYAHPDHLLWTPAQVATLVKLAEWTHETHQIPLAPCSAHDEPGIGFHTMWGPRGGDNPWIGDGISKTCPGTARIPQFYSEILTGLGYPVTGKEVDEIWKLWPSKPRITIWEKPPARRRKKRRRGRGKRKRAALEPIVPMFERDLVRPGTEEMIFRRRRNA